MKTGEEIQAGLEQAFTAFADYPEMQDDALLEYSPNGKWPAGRHPGRRSEAAPDIRLLPHPLPGKVAVREMYYFTVYHNQHHLRLLQECG